MKSELQVAFIRNTVKHLLITAASSDPKAFNAFFVGLIANVIGNLPEDYFKAMMKVEPCGREGCDCHLMRRDEAIFLEALRDDHKRHAGMLHREDE